MRKTLILSATLIISAFFLGNFQGKQTALQEYLNKNTQKEISAEKKTNTENNKNIQDTFSSFWNFNKSAKEDLKIFWKVWEILDESFFDKDELNTQERLYGAIKGMVSSIGDPYTIYLDPKETTEFEENLAGRLEGIGAELTAEAGHLVVVSPIKGTPAEKAGLKPGDIIYKIDEELASEMTLIQAIMKIRGPKGTKVALSIIREKIPKPLEISIIRDEINVPSLEMKFKDNIAIMEINQFNEQTLPIFSKSIGQILLTNTKGLIVDLRYNGGGYLDTAVDLLSEFFEEEKKAVIIKERDPKKNQILYTSGKGKLREMPLVVLINEGSASASEIFAGAIQDHKRGLIIGEKSYGKGSVQQIEELSDGSSLRLTIAKWFTPLDRSIDEVGILPDRVIEFNEDESDSPPNGQKTEKKDPQLEEAILYLKGL